MEFGRSEFDDGPSVPTPPRDIYGTLLAVVAFAAIVGIAVVMLFTDELGLDQRTMARVLKLLFAVLIFALLKGVKRWFGHSRSQT